MSRKSELKSECELCEPCGPNPTEPNIYQQSAHVVSSISCSTTYRQHRSASNECTHTKESLIASPLEKPVDKVECTNLAVAAEVADLGERVNQRANVEPAHDQMSNV